jgi:p-hydroxybenzoate 3-monooxygenase
MLIETTVAIVGAGPAGLMAGELLSKRGVPNYVIENRSREYCEQRVRAGLLEQGSVDLLAAIACDDRLRRECMVHDGTSLRFDGKSHRIDFFESAGKRVIIYGQQEIVKDLIAARIARGDPIEFEVSDTAVHGFDGERPSVTYRNADGLPVELRGRYIAGCDGFHGVTRPTVAARVECFEHAYPFAWLGILAQAPPLQHELVYVKSDEGFALFTMRSPAISRHYLQVPADERIEEWPDDRIWRELGSRLRGNDDIPELQTGPILKKEITPMRSFVCEPMRFGRLFLSGDAAHIVPPTGAKGMNLAMADAALLATAITEAEAGDAALVSRYSDLALERAWRAERFSHWMTGLMHVFPDHSPFQERMQHSELAYVASSRAGRELFAEQYAGLPFALPWERIAPWRNRL